MARLFCVIFVILGLSACGIGTFHRDSEAFSSQTNTSEHETFEIHKPQEAEEGEEEVDLKIKVGEYELSAAFENNSSAEEFKELLSQGSLTIEMDDYGGFEKVGALGTTLTRNDTQMTTEPGDIILYQGNQITIYYGVNSWNFTRLAKINDPSDLKKKLGDGTVSVTFSLE